MKKRKKIIIITIVLLLTLSVGYALLSTQLKINGVSTIEATKWDVHFANVQVKPGSVGLSTGDVAAHINESDNTLVEYTITLNQPGDYYEFTVDAVNAGTIDGMIGNISTKINGIEVSDQNPLPAPYQDRCVRQKPWLRYFLHALTPAQ